MQRRFAPLLLARWAVFASVLVAAATWAADALPTYPLRPIRIIVPFGPGSGTDVVARLIADELRSGLHGATVVVDNRAGASGIIGVDAAAKSPADGHTLLLTTVTTVSANPFLFKKLP